MLASRVRKARRNGACALCPKPVMIGQHVGLIAAGWAHNGCIVEANRLPNLLAEE
jgi:hypothetical protein